MLRSTGHVKLPAFVSVTTLTLKTGLSYILIFGHLGLPAMVVGAAVATCIAALPGVRRALRTLVYARRTPAAVRPRELLGADRVFVRLLITYRRR